MYKVGDLIIYGSTGVCRIADITVLDHMGINKDHLYYVLEPLYQNCTIFAPVNTTKIFMRPILTKDEAKKLIDTIPSIEVEVYHSSALNQLTGHYKASLETHDCSDLLEMCMSIYAKKQLFEDQKRKFGAVDEKFMKHAEELLLGELSVALDIDKEQVSEYITEKINMKRRFNGNECNK